MLRGGLWFQAESADCGKNGVLDLLDSACAVNRHWLWRMGVTRGVPLPEVLDQWAGLRMINLQTFLDGLFLVVGSLDQFFASDIVLAFNFRRVEFDVIGSS